MKPTSRSARQRLLDILDAIEKGRFLAKDLTLEQFSKSWLHRSAMERLIEIISEASRHLPPRIKGELSDHPLAGCRRHRECPSPHL